VIFLNVGFVEPVWTGNVAHKFRIQTYITRTEIRLWKVLVKQVQELKKEFL
jgi:hypothetical protein